ncbi:MAG: T9SS type A sorting domain-containing protein, partial [Hymenobacter sp.]|nr:T9SS type A sorting domain-containing protein [Hymenobacter sp.]
LTVAFTGRTPNGDVTVTLIDAVGRRVFIRTYARQNTLPVEAALPAGLYMMRVSSEQGVFTERVDFR